MSHRRPGGAEPPARGSSDLERVIAEVRARDPEYRRWWLGEHGSGSARPWPPPPWSDDDEERTARLGAADPGWMRSVADELERAHTDLREVGAQLQRVAGSAIGTAAAARCALLAASSHERACEAAELAAGARAMGERAEAVLDSVGRRVTGVLEGSPDLNSRALSGGYSDVHSDGYFGGYAAILRAVRTEVDSAIDRLADLFGPTPGAWAGEVRPTGRTDPPRPLRWTPEPGTGPRLPGTEARHVETDVGVRIARLPDEPRR